MSPCALVVIAPRRKYRVVVSHAASSSAQSEPVYVTWDEWAIVAEMVGKLSSAVATSTA